MKKKNKKASRIKSIIRYRKPRPDKPTPQQTAYVDPFYGTRKGIGTLPADLSFFQSLRLRLEGSNEVTRPYEQHAWVRGCVNTIANNISGVPFKLFTGETKNPSEVETGELYDLFQNPNPLMTKTQLWQATMIYLEIKGECIWLKDMPKGKEDNVAVVPLGIYPRDPVNFEPIVKNDVFVGWMYKDGKEETPLMLAQVIQFKYFNPYNYYRGLSPLSAAMMGVNQDWNAARYNLAFFENSADPGGIITYDPGANKEGLTDEQRTAIRENWENRHKGASRAKRIAILEGGLKYQQTEVSHVDMQFLDQRKWNREEIMMVYGVNKFAMTIYEDLNFATANAAAKQLWINTLIPKMNYLDDVLESKFFKYIDNGKVWSEFDTSDIKALQEDFNKKIETAHKMWQMGFPPNAINDRLELGMPKLTWGDTVFVSIAQVPAESLLGATPTSTEEESIKTKQNTAIDYDKFWVKYVAKILDPNEKKFQNRMKWYFYKLRTDQLARLADAEKTIKAAVAEKSIHKVEAFEVDSILFVEEEWDKKLKTATRPLYENIMIASGEELANELGGLFQFDLTDPAMLRFMNKRLSKIVGVNDTIRKQLRLTLMDGIVAKETIGELQNRVRTVFNFASNRSLTIARTETATASSGTRFLAMKQEGIEFHRWVTAGDEHVRTLHRNQGIVRVGQKFPNGLLAPSDPNGSPSLVINCRCIAVATQKKE
ncbi:hypothetical protein LCGC14_0609190 [marine sediment metagenome]|uniref:Phage head morphogenesis domain-containing protein n=1 Tax=marine sediment metagenome TaxID=412755 RepID=A0A0F9TUM8_9ZZZZ